MINKFFKISLIFIVVSTSSIFSMEKIGQAFGIWHSKDLPEIVLNIWFKENFDLNAEENIDPKMVEFYTKLLSKYQLYEINIESVYNSPIASAIAGINYAMTFEEMQQCIERKFKTMKDRGLIITPSEFEEIKDNYFPLKRTNLTRIWCAEYIKEKFKADNVLKDRFDVPDYVIVLDDPDQKTLKITWYFSDLFPLAVEITGASIYFKEIKGKEVANYRNEMLIKDIGPASEIGFRDFGDSGNIIKEKRTGKYYIVDTEIKSFRLPITDELFAKLHYARERFKYLNNKVLYEKSEIDLSDKKKLTFYDSP